MIPEPGSVLEVQDSLRVRSSDPCPEELSATGGLSEDIQDVV